MNRNALISAPISFPIVEPNSWDKWWDIWFKEATFIPKIVTNHNYSQAFWRGFDVYVKEGVDRDIYGYKTKNLNCPELFSSLFDNIDKFPMDIHVMRILSSMQKVTPHCDSDIPFTGIRSLMYDNNVRPNFYYVFGDNKEYQTLPSDTNTWMYNDHKSLHGTDFYFGHSKILIAYYGTVKDKMLDDNISENINRYKDYVIYDTVAPI